MNAGRFIKSCFRNSTQGGLQLNSPGNSRWVCPHFGLNFYSESRQIRSAHRAVPRCEWVIKARAPDRFIKDLAVFLNSEIGYGCGKARRNVLISGTPAAWP